MRALSCVISKRKIHLTKEIANSGEGTVWETSQSGIVAKIYHTPTQDRIEKLKIMISHPPKDPMQARNHVTFAWPQDILQEANGASVGFIMPMIGDSVKLSTIYNPRLRSRKAPRFNWKYLHTTALNIVLAVQSLHREGYVIGDIKPQNILVNKNALISIIDTDSFQVTDPYSHQVYRCLVGSEGFTPAELLGKELSDYNQTEIHDRFRLAVIIYLLLFGDHPFKGKWIAQGESPLPTDLIRHGYWPFAKRSLIKPGPNTIPLDIVHPTVQNGFQRSFTEGHANPNSRLTAKQWASALKTAIADLKACHIQSNHIFSHVQGQCYWCVRNSKLGVDIFNPKLKETLAKANQKKFAKKGPIKSGIGVSPLFTTQTTRGINHRLKPLSTTGQSVSGSFWQLGQRLSKLPPTFVGSLLCLLSLFGLGLLLLPEIQLESLQKIPELLESSLSRWHQQKPRSTQVQNAKLAGSANPQKSIVPTHSDTVTTLNISSDGQFLVSGSRDTSVKLWNLASGKLLKSLSDHYEPINLVRFAQDSSVIISSSQSGNIVLWNFPRGSVLRRLDKSSETGGGSLQNATTDEQGRYVISNGWSGGIIVHNLLTNQLKRIETNTIASEQALLVWPKTSSLISSASSGQLKVWDINSGKIVRSFPSLVDWQPIEPIRTMAVNGDGTMLASGNWSGTINLWDYSKGSITKSLVGHQSYISAMSFSPSKALLATGGGDHLIKLWDVNSGKMLRVLRGHKNDITALEFSPQKNLLVSGSEDGLVKVWNINSGQEIKTLSPLTP